MYNIKYNLN